MDLTRLRICTDAVIFSKWRFILKKLISGVIAAVMIFALIAGLSVTASAHVSFDALFINDNVYNAGKTNYNGDSELTLNPGDRIYILGWAAFSSSDGLKEIKYSVNGTEYACSDVYRDRPDAAAVVPMYNSGAHGGYGTDENMMELTGISALGAGSYTLSLIAYSYGGAKDVFKTYTLTVKDGNVTHIDALQKNSAVLGGAENLLNYPRVTVREEDKLYVTGWASFGTSDRLSKVVYTADGGEEYDCLGEYRDRPDAAKTAPMYNNGEHAGYGKDSKMTELSGISDLPFGMHDISLYAVSDAGKRSKICSFTLRVMSGAQPDIAAINGTGDINGDGETDNKDIVTLFRYMSGDVSDIVKENADVNGDGEENNKDVTVLFRYLSGYASDSDNGYFAGTPAYTVNGDTIIVDGVSYPNDNNMKNGIMFALDDLNRELIADTGSYSYDGSKNVGLFYFLWMGEHGDWGIFDNTKILAEGGSAAKNANYSGWGPVGAMHFWGEPLYGYYYSKDKWVMRKHIEELTLANVDFLYVDATNGFPYINNALSLMSIMHEFNEQGYTAPKIVFYTHSSCVNTVTSIYNNIYAANKYPDTWFYIDGKPLIIAYQSECRSGLSSAAYSFFSYREPQWPNEAQKTNGWPWMDFNYPQRVFTNNKGKAEAISVSVAQHNATVCFSDSAIYGNRTNRGRSYHNGKPGITEDSVLYGYNFDEQFTRAIEADVPYILVTGWNEWVAQRQDPKGGTKVIFIDNCDIEYSRDLEPMKGGYFDNYYMQLINNIRKYKGTAPALVQDTRKPIDINGGFDQWDDILVTYTDPQGDTANRNSLSFGSVRLKDTSGNNDIVCSKIVYDKNNIYFYVQTAKNITAPVKDTSWMQLFINSDYDGGTGFYGFDYIINQSVKSDGVSTAAKIERDGDTYRTVSEEEIRYKVSGNKMMISVPLEAIGIKDCRDIMIAFKWADSDTNITTMEQMYTEGDAAPVGRLCYTFQNHK